MCLTFHGLRHKPEGNTNGWYIWAGDDCSLSDFFSPLHYLSYLREGTRGFDFSWPATGLPSLNRVHPTCTERQSLNQEYGWKGGDRGGLAQWEQFGKRNN